MEKVILGGGLRKNEGKLRYDLIHPTANKGLAEVLTLGSKKYAERNWEKGMKWSNVISSLKRHMAAIEAGEDYDQETGLLHADHVQCNAHFLSAYYSIYPQGDDRAHHFRPKLRIGLDIDGVICDFIGGIERKLYPIDGDFVPLIPTHWNDPLVVHMLEEVRGDKEFWLGLRPLLPSTHLPIQPVVYITQRSVDKEITQEWLDKNGFPHANLVSLTGGSKLQACIDNKVDIFVDDKYETYEELNQNGVFCYLFDQPWNRKYNVGHKRIYSLDKLK